MDEENKLKGTMRIKLQSLKKEINSVEEGQSGDPTKYKATFSIIDFGVSGNKSVISKEIAEQCAYTLKGTPLLCKYYPTTDYENQDDHFGDHAEQEEIDRYGNKYIGADTIAIGSAESEGYIGTIKDENGNDVEALLCDYVLWAARYPNIVTLIEEMYENNMPLYSSCEYFYFNYSMKNGIQYVDLPVYFDGHCILCSGENGSEKIDPAYDNSKLISLNSKLKKAINSAIKNNKEAESMKKIEEMLKIYCELSHGDTRSAIYTALSKVMTADKYNSIWISQYDLYDTYFVYELYEDEGYHYYKVEYTKNADDTITVNYEGQQEVHHEDEWIPVTQATENLQKAENAKAEVEKELNEVKSEKENVEKQFNEASEKIVSLNAKIKEYEPLVETYEKEKMEKALNEKTSYYEVKFKSLNAVDKFKSEEVQELIKKSVNEKDATLQLNTMLVDLVDVKEEKQPESNKMIKELNSKIKNLIPETGLSFEERYGLK